LFFADEMEKETQWIRLQVIANGKIMFATLKAGSYFGEINILNMGTEVKSAVNIANEPGARELFLFVLITFSRFTFLQLCESVLIRINLKTIPLAIFHYFSFSRRFIPLVDFHLFNRNRRSCNNIRAVNRI